MIDHTMTNRARALRLAVVATVVAGMVVATTGCGGSDHAERAKPQATAPSRGFSEDVPADATATSQSDIDAIVAQMQELADKLKASSTGTATQQTTVDADQAAADRLREAARLAYQASLIQGTIDIASGVISLGGATSRLSDSISLAAKSTEDPLSAPVTSDLKKAVTDFGTALKTEGTSSSTTDKLQTELAAVPDSGTVDVTKLTEIEQLTQQAVADQKDALAAAKAKLDAAIFKSISVAEPAP